MSIAIVATIMYGACGLAHNSLVLMLREVLQGVERALVPGRLADVVGRAAGPQRIAEWVIVVSNLFADNRTFMRSAAVAIWIVLFGWSLFGATSIALAHGSDAHEQERPRASQAINSRTHDEQIPKPTDDGISGHELTNSETALSLSTVVQDLTLVDFPTLHPLVVHVPVTFIPAAFVFAVLSLFFPQRALTWLALAFSLVGLFGGFVAAFPLHPHATGLPVAAAATLEKHEFFAFATLALGLVAVLAALIAIWRPRRLPKFVLSVLLLIAAACVAIAGHYGGTLAYVHGVGVKGKYLSSHWALWSPWCRCRLHRHNKTRKRSLRCVSQRRSPKSKRSPCRRTKCFAPERNVRNLWVAHLLTFSSIHTSHRKMTITV